MAEQGHWCQNPQELQATTRHLPASVLAARDSPGTALVLVACGPCLGWCSLSPSRMQYRLQQRWLHVVGWPTGLRPGLFRNARFFVPCSCDLILPRTLCRRLWFRHSLPCTQLCSDTFPSNFMTPFFFSKAFSHTACLLKSRS